MKSQATNAPLRAWLQRYLLAEVVSTACALLAAGVTLVLSWQPLAAALANTAAGSLSYYAVMLVRELRSGGIREVGRAVGLLVFEFGPAELLDTLLRPTLIYIGLTFAPHPALGMLFGKVTADVCFYAPTIISYQLLTLKRQRGTLAHRDQTAAQQKALYKQSVSATPVDIASKHRSKKERGAMDAVILLSSEGERMEGSLSTPVMKPTTETTDGAFSVSETTSPAGMPGLLPSRTVQITDRADAVVKNSRRHTGKPKVA